MDGLPSGEIDVSQVLELSRKGGSSEMGDVDTNNAEPVFTSGLLDGRTTGAPVCALIRNRNQNQTNNSECLRPGHADLCPDESRFADLRGSPFSAG